MSQVQLYEFLDSRSVLTDQVRASLDEYFNSKKSSKKIQFGKYKGKTVNDISLIDEKYLKWLVKQNWCFEDIKSEIKKLYPE